MARKLRRSLFIPMSDLEIHGCTDTTYSTYTNTHVAGTDSVNIKSGAEITLKGATAEGKQVHGQAH